MIKISNNVSKIASNLPKSIILNTNKAKMAQNLPLVRAKSDNAYLKYVTAISVITIQTVYKKIGDLLSGKPPRVAKAHPKDTVILHQFPRAFKTPSLSPFAMKLETFCRAYEVKYQNQFGMDRSSKGLIPFIKLNDHVVEDSQKCIEYLSRIFELDYNSHLTEEEKASARLVVKLCDDSLKWSMALMRFKHNKNGMKDIALPRLGYWIFSYRISKAAKFAGYGTWSKNEIIENANKDLKALDVVLGENKFFFSKEKPCDVDFAVFGLVAQLVYNDTTAVNHFLNDECHNLVRHCENMKQTYWPDWDKNVVSKKVSKKQI